MIVVLDTDSHFLSRKSSPEGGVEAVVVEHFLFH